MLVYADVPRSPEEGGYPDPGDLAEDAGAFLRCPPQQSEAPPTRLGPAAGDPLSPAL